MSEKPTLKLDWCSHEAAKYAVEHWHYSRCVPNQKTVKIGVWEDGKFIGAVIFGDGANNQMFKPYGLDYTEGCELVRIALASHQFAVSRIVKIALGFLKKEYQKIRLVISFADPEQGHIGGIYQAGNWIYTGMTEPADEYIVNGARMHGRALRATRSTHPARNVPASNVMEWAKKVLDHNTQRVPGSSKYRYLMPLDNEMRKQVEPLRKPYPKRGTGETDNAAQSNAQTGGASPTVPLSTIE